MVDCCRRAGDYPVCLQTNFVSPKRGREEPRVACRYTVPAQGMDIGAEEAGIVKSLPADGLPDVFIQDSPIELESPYHVELIALGIVIDTGQAHNRVQRTAAVRLDILDEIGPRPDPYDLTSTYFEGRTCPLAKLGYSRNGKRDKVVSST
jgi:hypothetical protein